MDMFSVCTWRTISVVPACFACFSGSTLHPNALPTSKMVELLWNHLELEHQLDDHMDEAAGNLESVKSLCRVIDSLLIILSMLTSTVCFIAHQHWDVYHQRYKGCILVGFMLDMRRWTTWQGSKQCSSHLIDRCASMKVEKLQLRHMLCRSLISTFKKLLAFPLHRQTSTAYPAALCWQCVNGRQEQLTMNFSTENSSHSSRTILCNTPNLSSSSKIWRIWLKDSFTSRMQELDIRVQPAVGQLKSLLCASLVKFGTNFWNFAHKYNECRLYICNMSLKGWNTRGLDVQVPVSRPFLAYLNMQLIYL